MEIEPYNNAIMPQSSFGMNVLKVKERLNFICLSVLNFSL